LNPEGPEESSSGQESEIQVRPTWRRRHTCQEQEARSPDNGWEGKSIGRYQVQRLLSPTRGGYVEVYQAIDTKASLGRRAVALKRLCVGPHVSAPDKQNFLNEINSLAKISANYVVPVYDAEEMEDSLFYTMKFVDGKTLVWHLKQLRPPIKRRVEIFIQICIGVSAMHDVNMVHRDISYRNVMVDNRGDTWLVDFGMAKLLDRLLPGQAAEDSQKGTAIFMAPEQYVGRGDVTVKADIYSLGIMLFWLVTDVFPYEDARYSGGRKRTKDQINLRQMEYIHSHPPQAPSKVARGIPRSLDSLVVSCLAREPTARPSCEEIIRSAKEICRELARAEQRTWRNRGLLLGFTAAAVILPLLTIALAVMLNLQVGRKNAIEAIAANTDRMSQRTIRFLQRETNRLASLTTSLTAELAQSADQLKTAQAAEAAVAKSLATEQAINSSLAERLTVWESTWLTRSNEFAPFELWLPWVPAPGGDQPAPSSAPGQVP